MRTVDQDLDRVLTLLKARMRDRGYTQLEVQEHLGWGRSYISQLVNRDKSIRVDQLLAILNVIGVKAEDFWAEIYRSGAFGRPIRARRAGTLHEDLRRTRRLLDEFVTVLTRKGLITADELDGATRRFRSASSRPAETRTLGSNPRSSARNDSQEHS